MTNLKLTKEQAIIVSAYTGILMCDFADMQKAVEEKLGHPVFTHEFASVTMSALIRDKFKKDFLAICPDGLEL